MREHSKVRSHAIDALQHTTAVKELFFAACVAFATSIELPRVGQARVGMDVIHLSDMTPHPAAHHDPQHITKGTRSSHKARSSHCVVSTVPL